MSKSKTEEEGAKPSKHKLKSICVFGESDVGKDGEFLQAARNLGHEIARRNINFIYGGGIQGLGGSAAISASMSRSQVMGILVNSLDDNKYSIGKELRVSTLPERMGWMLYNAEAFVALPGGLEALDAIFSITYWAKLNFHQKPLGLLNVNGFYDSLLSFLDHAVEQGFIPQTIRRAIISASTADKLIDQLQVYTSSLVKQKDGQSSDNSRNREPDTTLRL